MTYPLYQRHTKFWNLPPEISAMGFTQKRSQLYPRCPGCIDYAAQEQRAAYYMPQRMAFQRWKTPPQRDMGSGSYSPYHVGQHYPYSLPQMLDNVGRKSGSVLRTTAISRRGHPLMGQPAAMAVQQQAMYARAQAMGLNRLPKAATQAEVAIQIMSSGIPRRQGVPPHQLARWEAAQSFERISTEQLVDRKRAAAMAEAGMAVTNARAVYGEMRR